MNKLPGPADDGLPSTPARPLTALQRRPAGRTCYLLLWAAVAVVPNVDAGQLFKCTEADGHVTYQQTQCSGAGGEISVRDNQVGSGIRDSENEWMKAREKTELEVNDARAAEVRDDLDRKAQEQQRADQECRDAKRVRNEMNDRAEAFEAPKVRRYYRAKAQDAEDWIAHNCAGRY